MERPVFRLVVDNTGESPVRFARPLPADPPERARRKPVVRPLERPATREQIADAMAKIRRILDMESGS